MTVHSLIKWSLACNFFSSFDRGSCPLCFAPVIKKERLS